MAESYEERANELEREADLLDKGGNHVDNLIKETREDWEQKKSSNTAPGATDPEGAAPGGLGDEDDKPKSS